MAWRFVVQPNGLLARFSEVVDDFTDYDMSDDEAVQVAIDDYDCGRRTANEKISNARSLPERWQECLEIIGELHGAEKVAERVEQMSKSPADPSAS